MMNPHRAISRTAKLCAGAIVAAAIAIADQPASASALGTTFTYQGQLKQGGVPVNGAADLRFTLRELSPPGQIGAPITLNNVTIVSGQFTADLDFGAAAFAGLERWLQIEVRIPSGSGNFTPLGPMQKLNATPYALYAKTGDWPFKFAGSNALYTAGGKVGIGTTTPSATLHVAGTAAVESSMKVGNATQVMTLDGNSIEAAQSLNISSDTAMTLDSAAGMTIASDASLALSSSGSLTITGAAVSLNGVSTLGIGGGAGGFMLGVNGPAGKPGGGSWSTLSDARLKKNIRPLDDPLGRLMRLRGVTFEYDDPEMPMFIPGVQTGMIAQEVEQVFPEWVSENSDGYLNVTFRGFEALTVEAMRQLREEKDRQIREQQERIDQLESRNRALDGRIADLESQIRRLASEMRELRSR